MVPIMASVAHLLTVKALASHLKFTFLEFKMMTSYVALVDLPHRKNPVGANEDITQICIFLEVERKIGVVQSVNGKHPTIYQLRR